MKQSMFIVLLLTFMGVSAQTSVDVKLLMQEEQLARDVYQLATEKYQMHVFDCKVNAEASHWDMLKAYSKEPLAAMPEYGQIRDSAFAASFADLKIMVNSSVAEALQAGAMIEETDIHVLETNLVVATDEQLRQLLQNLINASEQHLRSFLVEMNASGVPYTPTMLTEERINTIMKGGGCNPGAACKRNASCGH